MRLSDFGERICILGPSNSGKSTLAAAIGRKCGLPVVHLDRLYHLPDTDWVPRPKEDFVALHDEAIAGDRWVIDGNYGLSMPRRFSRATGVILLDVPMPLSLYRYVRRTLFQSDRPGGLDGGQESLKWEMIRHIAVTTPNNRRRWADMFEELTLPKIRLTSAAAIRRCRADWQLD
ncbi:AAA family ATPase [Pleomorphomonas carboxyditropha]|uniref:AAA family ATPase n=1 Tax=Pleomorphomonas carboxyditropha TaxID=2023338 RepID=A0A2G9WXZ4_9HYPH|nr:AAA family ATPase [Pleomorphomonas carboxyditropha]PIO99581.1 AAA family ATPase [Pleomorphomonas carboxyditropha]